jgi:hypothetical protein
MIKKAFILRNELKSTTKLIVLLMFEKKANVFMNFYFSIHFSCYNFG